MTPLRSLREALAFLTPVGGAAVPKPAALPWFGTVGALVGSAVGVTWWTAGHWLPQTVAAALAVLADVVLTGMLHLDGLADAADGLLPPLSRDRRLTVMRDPHAGVFGVVVVVTVLLLRYAVLASLPLDGRTVLATAALWSIARTAMAVVVVTVPYARDDGLASAFLGARWPTIAAAGVPLAVVLAALSTVGPLHGLLAVIAAGAGAALVVAFARRRIGGFTGDVLGAAGVTAETVGLVVLAVRA
jgi:adenosylcobinamide-GDP ribazoletransferase